MSFINFSSGSEQFFGGEIVEIKKGALIKFVETFDNPNFKGEITATVRLTEVSCGTELNIVQLNIV